MSNCSFVSPSDFSFTASKKKIEVRCKIVGVPRPMHRARIANKNNAHLFSPNDDNMNSFISAVETALKNSKSKPHFDIENTAGPVELIVNFYFARPQAHFVWDSQTGTHRVPSSAPHFVTKKPDVDNLVKLVMDALQNLFYRKDQCVAHINAKKLWMEKPGENFIENKAVLGCTIFHIIKHKNNSCNNF